MCGLAAIFAYAPDAPPINDAELFAISDAMRSRGPDGEGKWISPDQRVGLAHRRLSILDLGASAAQPMTFPAKGANDGLAEGRYRIVYNGEIYNFRALRDELQSHGHIFRSHSDTEVLLHLYHRYGREMVSHLRGMYAFAIWDEEQRGIFLGRDPFGIKPLYYSDDGMTLRVASQVKALRAGGRAGTGLDPAGHVGFFLFGYVPEPHTLYSDIHSLEAGTTLWIDCGGHCRSIRFFDVAESLEAGNIYGKTGEMPDLRQVLPDLRQALIDSVRHHLVSDVPVGVFLSSGLDSATITGLASEIQDSPLETMTLGFEEFRGTRRDEAPLALEIAKTYGTSHTTRWANNDEFHNDIEMFFEAMDQPTIDGVNVFFIAKEAAKMGLKVALSGIGGDELFGGYNSFKQIPALVKTFGHIPGARSLGKGFRAVSAPLLKHMTSPKYAGLLEYGCRFEDAYLLRRGLFMPWELTDILDPTMVEEGWRTLHPQIMLEKCHKNISEPKRKVAAMEMIFYMRSQLLRDADWAGMAHSLEIRVPLVDRVLFNSISPGLGRTKGFDKQAMARTPLSPLPETVMHRSKTGFFVPIREWIQGGDEVAPERGLRGWARRVYDEAL